MVFAQNRSTMPNPVKKRESFELLNLKYASLLCDNTSGICWETIIAFSGANSFLSNHNKLHPWLIVRCSPSMYVLQFSLLLKNCNSFLGTLNRDCKNPVCSHLTSFFWHEKLAFSGKGQLIWKCLFGVFNSPKKTEKFNLNTKYGTSSWIILVRFLELLKIPKRHFEINWHSALSVCFKQNQ